MAHTLQVRMAQKMHFPPFDDKIKLWVPRMSGEPFDKGKNRNWSDFKALRAVRDREDALPKTAAYAHVFDDMAKLLKRFRGGIAGLLLDLCVHFGENRCQRQSSAECSCPGSGM